MAAGECRFSAWPTFRYPHPSFSSHVRLKRGFHGHRAEFTLSYESSQSRRTESNMLRAPITPQFSTVDIAHSPARDM
jgi:hypothetical protein